MTPVSVSEACVKLYSLIDDAVSSHEPVLITGERGNAVLLSEADWSSIQETLFLLSVPGMRESIVDGIKASADECSRELGW